MLHEIECWVVKKPTRKQCQIDENITLDEWQEKDYKFNH
jgi:hypothetical protein